MERERYAQNREGILKRQWQAREQNKHIAAVLSTWLLERIVTQVSLEKLTEQLKKEIDSEI